MIGAAAAELVLDNHLATTFHQAFQTFEIVTGDARAAMKQNHWPSLTASGRANAMAANLADINLNPLLMALQSINHLLFSSAPMLRVRTCFTTRGQHD